MLATASGDKTVRVWDARSNKAVTTVTTKGENINITWSPDGHTIAVGNKEDLVTFIDSRTYKVKADRQFKFEVNEISWNMANDLSFIKTFSRLEWPVRTISFSHDGALLASASEDMRIDIGHVETTQKVAEIAVDSR